ncbi:MAG TPA: ATP-grasp domain-containing protein [Lysobacter sp.]
MRVLVTGAGGPSAVSVWKSLAAEHDIFFADMDPSSPGLYLVPAGRRFLIPRGDDAALVPVLIGLCRTHAIEVLISTVDSELAAIAEAQAGFAAIGTRVPLSPAPVLHRCRDKWALLSHLHGNPFVPDCVELTTATLPTIDRFPCFAKPRTGSGSRGIAMINSAAELAALPLDETYLIQELLPGPEYSVDVYVSQHGELIAAVPRERIRTDSGIAITSRTVHMPELMDAAANIALTVGVRYVANVQFKQASDGHYKLLEINPRFPGSLPLTVAAGVDIPRLLMDDLQGRPLPRGPMDFKEVLMVRYWTEKYLDPSEWQALCRR